VPESIIRRTLVRDALLIVAGSFVFALGVDAFMVPNGLAAGGVTGIATVTHKIAADQGFYLPVGIQTIVMNVLLMIPVFRSGGLRYAARTVAGILASSLLIDALAPFVPPLCQNDLLLACLWGGAVTGLGLGLVFRSGGNTGGTDIVAQLLSKSTGWPVGTLEMVADIVIIAGSIPVFSFENALYAAICMFVAGRVIDTVVEGPSSQRAAYIISGEHDRIANAILYELGRGCTEIQARGVWSGSPRPMLFVVLGRRELGMLKSIVAEIDPDAIVIIAEIHEAFGEGFKEIGVQ
jgi:uncharacterized membrane-anchored protein YitT (DUF2179 family)